MYGWLWHHLPGPWFARLGELTVLLVAVLALLFYVIFPAVDPHLPFNDVTVNGPTSPSPSPSVTPSVTPSALATG